MKRSTVMQFAAAMMLLLASTLSWSDTSMLRPPKGAKVAIIVFEDLECPQCAALRRCCTMLPRSTTFR